MPTEKPDSTPSSPEAEEGTSADKLFKTAFELFLRNLVELVRPEVAARLDLEHARVLSPKLFADFRKQGLREPDLVAEAKTVDGEEQLVVVHIDVEGAFRNVMDDRMREYAMHLELKTRKPAWRRSSWTVHSRWRRPLAALMRSKVWDRVEQKLRCLTAISRAENLDLSRQYVLTRVVDNYLELSENEEERFTAELEREANKDVRDMVVTWEEALAESKAEGLAEGRTEGRTEGEALGQLEAARKAILLLAKRCHREIPPDFEETIRAIDDLDRLYRILTNHRDGSQGTSVPLASKMPALPARPHGRRANSDRRWGRFLPSETWRCRTGKGSDGEIDSADADRETRFDTVLPRS